MIRHKSWMIGVGILILAAQHHAQSQSALRVELGTAVTLGKFSYQDATVDVSEEFFNPRVAVEYVLPNGTVAIGVQYALSENDYSLDYSSGSKRLDGDLTVERTELLPYVRFGSPERANLRIAYKMFEYDISNGELDEYRHGRLVKLIRDGEANADMSTGVDVELNFGFGEQTRLSFMVGASYFIGAKYSWTYRNELAGNRIETGSAKLDALSVRFGPEISHAFSPDLRLFAQYLISGTSWLGSKDADEDYAGTDVMSAVILGLRYNWDL